MVRGYTGCADQRAWWGGKEEVVKTRIKEILARVNVHEMEQI